MPRIARKKSNNGIYHVIVRGINRQDIFHEEEDYTKYSGNIGRVLLLLFYAKLEGKDSGGRKCQGLQERKVIAGIERSTGTLDLLRLKN
ncbi:hypothetical protein SOV_45690 [Sporomusa ovata DSM 2662]|uniref:hypothetical protein n=1 Tax=Sporomusa ovata TaxID=2378 RepID=UPI00038824B4|nr:hypothetical protein [Sporomusa ovata]EQB26957.1 hypothetical protein SOV_3c08310 [Sporomusa ovata DSM 2662]